MSGKRQNASPMTPSDIVAVDKNDSMIEGFIPVTSFLSNDNRAANISSGLNYTYYYGYGMNKVMAMSMSAIYLYVRGKAYQEGNYLTNVYIISKKEIAGDSNISCENIDNSYLMSSLAAFGAHSVVKKNLNLEDSDNATYLGYSKNKSSKDPITNMFLYYAGDTDQDPPREMKKDGVIYRPASNTNLFLTD